MMTEVKRFLLRLVASAHITKNSSKIPLKKDILVHLAFLFDALFIKCDLQARKQM